MLATGTTHTIIVLPAVTRVRLVGLLFETDKSFLLPSSMAGIRQLKALYDQHGGQTVLISGHADRAGSAAHNLGLSVDRAQSVAAFLQDNADDWMSRYTAGAHPSAVWGTREDQHMLASVRDPGGAPYFAGPVSGSVNAATRDAINRFQADNGLAASAMNTTTRHELVRRYMATDGTTLPSGTTLVVHGCGEHHPSVPTADSAALAENRRVELFFFRGSVTPSPVDPCRAGGCAEYPEWVRRSVQTVDVNLNPEVVVHLIDEVGLPLRDAKAQIVMPDGSTEDVITDSNGDIRPRVPPGSSFNVIVFDVHEGGVGDALVTPSGQHFTSGGTGARP